MKRHTLHDNSYIECVFLNFCMKNYEFYSKGLYFSLLNVYNEVIMMDDSAHLSDDGGKV